MRLNGNLHLAYCTNVHPGEDWPETFSSLEKWTLKIRDRVCANRPYAIGLRLSDLASRQLSVPRTLVRFEEWLERNECYVFTINGFPFGRFHNTRVKENVYLPDWTSSERLDYTNRLFDLLSVLLPPGLEGSVSTLPGSFKEFIRTEEQLSAIRANLWRSVEHAARISDRRGSRFHLALEPEPFGLFENSDETVHFFETLRSDRKGDDIVARHLGVNYDTCHFAVEFENAKTAISKFRREGIQVGKIHLSNALRLRPDDQSLAKLTAFMDDVYLHQVIARHADGTLTRYKDLDLALANGGRAGIGQDSEWRVHFHVPLGSKPEDQLGTTSEHLLETMDLLREEPGFCSHLEIETYTWGVLPAALKSLEVVTQVVAEYEWVLREMSTRGLADRRARNPETY